MTENATLAAAPVKTASFKLNGKPASAPLGTMLIEACRLNGVAVPNFCYHPGLSVAGNCRMCLVKEGKNPKPIISCSTPLAEGMEVDTESPEVKKARENVLEFLLINHPLDCPVCDKAGECMLQDHSYAHGPDKSRFKDPKEIRHTKVLGPKIKIWGNRCILCTRCIRFLDEVSGTSEFCIVERGDRAIIDIFPGRPLDNPMALNVVDVCPVGALISTDFLYQARVWYMKREKTLCAGCSRGCNIEVESIEGNVKRLRPRENAAVNGHWMCDYGRLEYRYVNGGDRLARFRGTSGETLAPAAAIDATARALKAGAWAEEAGTAKRTGGAFLLASHWMTNEELFVLRRIAAALGGAPVLAIGRAEGPSHKFPGGFRISADKNPNRRGAEEILGREAAAGGAAALRERLDAGEVRSALAVGGYPEFSSNLELRGLLGRVGVLSILHFSEGPDVSAVRLAGATFAEKDGTFVNDDGRVQRLRRAIDSPGDALADLEILQRIAAALGAWKDTLSAEGVFRLLAAEVAAFAGMSYREIGEGGKTIGPCLPRLLPP